MLLRILAAVVSRARDTTLERWFGSRPAQRVLFRAIARRFDPDAACGFEGDLSYELGRPATRRPPICWTIGVSGRRARARRGAAAAPALKLRFALADFVRVAAGAIDPAVAVLHDRATFEGDFGLVARLPEMFRAPRSY